MRSSCDSWIFISQSIYSNANVENQDLFNNSQNWWEKSFKTKSSKSLIGKSNDWKPTYPFLLQHWNNFLQGIYWDWWHYLHTC